MSTQGLLPLKGPRRPTLSNFISGENDALIETLREGLEPGGWTFLAGPPGSGRSHLLSAVLSERLKAGEAATFVALCTRSQRALLEQASGDWVILDDIDALAGSADDEMLLFNALNRWRVDQTGVLMSGAGRDRFELPDLRSRLGQATRLTLKRLDETDLRLLIEQLAEEYEVVLGRGAADYLLSRTARNSAAIARLIETLAGRALSERRTISVPLIREEIRRDPV
ncbi:MAG: AAA family ATPase [Pseudomonadota bacterium]